MINLKNIRIKNHEYKIFNDEQYNATIYYEIDYKEMEFKNFVLADTIKFSHDKFKKRVLGSLHKFSNYVEFWFFVQKHIDAIAFELAFVTGKKLKHYEISNDGL